MSRRRQNPNVTWKEGSGTSTDTGTIGTVQSTGTDKAASSEVGRTPFNEMLGYVSETPCTLSTLGTKVSSTKETFLLSRIQLIYGKRLNNLETRNLIWIELLLSFSGYNCYFLSKTFFSGIATFVNQTGSGYLKGTVSSSADHKHSWRKDRWARLFEKACWREKETTRGNTCWIAWCWKVINLFTWWTTSSILIITRKSSTVHLLCNILIYMDDSARFSDIIFTLIYILRIVHSRQPRLNPSAVPIPSQSLFGNTVQVTMCFLQCHLLLISIAGVLSCTPGFGRSMYSFQKTPL